MNTTDFASIYNHVKSNMVGRIATDTICANILQFVCHVSSGDHLEIGSLWGGTAILAGLSRDCTVYCIDPLTDEESSSYKATPEGFKKNLTKFGVDAVLMRQKSNPWPDEIKDMEFGTAFIDGSHKKESVLWDWNHVKKITRQYVIFHDLHLDGPLAVFNEASKDPNWRPLIRLAEMDANIGVLEAR